MIPLALPAASQLVLLAALAALTGSTGLRWGAGVRVSSG